MGDPSDKSAVEPAKAEKAPSANSNLVLRVITALVLVPLILWLILRGPAWGFYLFVAVASVIGAIELFSMTHKGDRVSQVFGVLLSVGLGAEIFFATGDRLILASLLVMPLIGPLWTLVRLGDLSTAALRAFAMSAGPIYVGIPLIMLATMKKIDPENGPGYVVLALMFAWFSDTGGYFAGRFLGKHKLYPAVSPKKTVEGSLGGLAGACLGACMASFWYLPTLPISRSIPLALFAGAIGQAGDLAESLLKRSVDVKDSGAILPGHGGMLDRIDALLYTSTIVFLYHGACAKF